MASPEEASQGEWPVRVFENPALEKKKFSFLNRFRYDIPDLMRGPFLRRDWSVLVDIDPEEIPWAEPADDEVRRTGRAGVVRAPWIAIGDAGGLKEGASRVLLREWGDQVQMSDAHSSFFSWSEDNTFTAAAFAESEWGRVAMGVKRGNDVAVPVGQVLLEQLRTKELSDRYPDVLLVA
jgi:hypothetical protein